MSASPDRDPMDTAPEGHAPARAKRLQKLQPLQPPKRQRVLPLPTAPPPPRLTSLPIKALCLILRYLHIDAPSPALSNSMSNPLSVAAMARLIPMRTLSRSLRDAFDAHVVALSFTDVPASRFPLLLTTLLPRLSNLVAVSLPTYALCHTLCGAWHGFFSVSKARIQHVTFARAANLFGDPGEEGQGSDADTMRCFVQGVSASLERVSTTCQHFVAAVGTGASHVHTLQLLMDDIPEHLLLSFRSSHSFFLLYRQPVPSDRAKALVDALKHMQHACLHVHLRLNQMRSSQFAIFPQIPGLHKVSLHNGHIENVRRGMVDLASCRHLEEVQFEWVHQLSGDDIADLAKGMRHRLKNLRIWQCDQVTDDGLVAVARWCPQVEVDLRFVRDQFSHSALAALGDRVSWGSFAL